MPNCKSFGDVFFIKNGATMHSRDVVDSTDGKALTEVGTFRLRVLTQLHAIAHGPDDVCFCQGLVCDTAAGPPTTPSVTFSMEWGGGSGPPEVVIASPP